MACQNALDIEIEAVAQDDDLDTAPAREVMKIAEVRVQTAGVGKGSQLFGRAMRGAGLALETLARINLSALPLRSCIVRSGAAEAAEEKVAHVLLRHGAVEIA